MPIIKTAQAPARSNSSNSARTSPSMIRVGSLTFTKKLSPEVQKELRAYLESEEVQMWLTVYLPKGESKITLQDKEKILLNFKKSTNDKVPEFVIGSAAIPID